MDEDYSDEEVEVDSDERQVEGLSDDDEVNENRVVPAKVSSVKDSQQLLYGLVGHLTSSTVMQFFLAKGHSMVRKW